MKLPYLITGDNYEVLRKYGPISNKKITVLGYSVFLPIITFTASIILTSVIILELSTIITVINAIIAILIIGIIEIFIIRSNKSFILAIFRLFLAVCINIIGALAIDIALFNTDIQSILAEVHSTKIESINTTKTLYSINNDKLMSKRDSLLIIRSNLEIELADELGGLTETNKVGRGPRAKGLERNLSTLIKEISLIDSIYNVNIIKDKELKDTKLSIYLNSSSTVLMAEKIKALHSLMKKDKIVFYVWLIITITLIGIEIIPVTYKLISPLTKYEIDCIKLEKLE